jgi:hypothetical protein
MKRPTSTILKKQADGAERERVGNNGPLFDRKIETATGGLIPTINILFYNDLPSTSIDRIKRILYHHHPVVLLPFR